MRVLLAIVNLVTAAAPFEEYWGLNQPNFYATKKKTKTSRNCSLKNQNHQLEIVVCD